MKKIIFVLVVLLFAAPAWARVDITAVQVGESNEVNITYAVVPADGNLPRAFGLDITVSDGNIVACTAAMEGECTLTIQGFGIFPGTINIDDSGEEPVVISYGTPVAPGTARGALPGLDSNGITIELGSLYVDANAPLPSGILCTIVITESCTVTIAGNAARCGEGSPAWGVVMEDTGEVPDVNFTPGDVIYVPGPVDCFPSAHPDYDEWLAVGKPDSWCNLRQCHGDADNAEELIGKFMFWVGYNDLNIFLANWMDKAGVTSALQADFSHDKELIGKFYFRVGYNDLGILLNNWMDKAGSPPDCQDVP